MTKTTGKVFLTCETPEQFDAALSLMNLTYDLTNITFAEDAIVNLENDHHDWSRCGDCDQRRGDCSCYLDWQFDDWKDREDDILMEQEQSDE